jgi:hypothetical protein
VAGFESERATAVASSICRALLQCRGDSGQKRQRLWHLQSAKPCVNAADGGIQLRRSYGCGGLNRPHSASMLAEDSGQKRVRHSKTATYSVETPTHWKSSSCQEAAAALDSHESVNRINLSSRWHLKTCHTRRSGPTRWKSSPSQWQQPHFCSHESVNGMHGILFFNVPHKAKPSMKRRVSGFNRDVWKPKIVPLGGKSHRSTSSEGDVLAQAPS